MACKTMLFQLTRLMRGVTNVTTDRERIEKISTHTPHARRDRRKLIDQIEKIRFQLTRLMRGVTEYTLKRLKRQ